MVTLNNIRKAFEGQPVLKGVNLRVEDGETLAVLGRSGSGKTTLLKVMAGIHRAYEGSMRVDGEAIDHLPPQKRGIVYLYQDALLFPHLTARENIAFGLNVRNATAIDREEKVTQVLRSLRLSEHGQKYPAELSGGQRQRVAFGRALIIQPAILLLDEPFASLDFGTRREMQRLFKRVAHQHAMTTLFVTHDAREALSVGSRFAHMEDGRLHVFPDRQAFINDEASGIRDEINFWNEIDHTHE